MVTASIRCNFKLSMHMYHDILKYAHDSCCLARCYSSACLIYLRYKVSGWGWGADLPAFASGMLDSRSCKT